MNRKAIRSHPKRMQWDLEREGRGNRRFPRKVRSGLQSSQHARGTGVRWMSKRSAVIQAECPVEICHSRSNATKSAPAQGRGTSWSRELVHPYGRTFTAEIVPDMVCPSRKLMNSMVRLRGLAAVWTAM